MEKVRYLINEAKKNLKTADHLVYMTYPLIKDPKLITSIAGNLQRSLMYAMDALVRYEQLYRHIPMATHPDTRFELFKEKCIPAHKLDKDIITVMHILTKALEEKQINESVVRRDLISSGKVLSYDQLKNMTNKSKAFLLQVQGVITKNDG
ncbi:hypothetical protein J4468_04625 [Candidatus Woesearchaeota archaeon]|nr:hypothetical protein [Candidatus Woesearchaeota archaeon]